MKKIIRVGTRESNLAMVQSKWVISEIKRKFPYLEFELVGIKTTGDLILDKRLDKIGGKGLFIKELENALINNSIDIAVHSMKDMPAELHEDLTIAAVSKREDPRDALVTIDGRTLEELQNGAIIGTSSVRREVQLLELRPDFEIKTLRGNVLTRLNKLQNKEYDGILLAIAGLNRLDLADKVSQGFSIKQMIPAVGQGALAIEARKGDNFDYLLESINDQECALAISAERAFMIKMNGSCSTPIAAHAIIEGNIMKLSGMLATDDKTEIYKAYVEGEKHNAVILGEKLGEMIIERRKK